MQSKPSCRCVRWALLPTAWAVWFKPTCPGQGHGGSSGVSLGEEGRWTGLGRDGGCLAARGRGRGGGTAREHKWCEKCTVGWKWNASVCQGKGESESAFQWELPGVERRTIFKAGFDQLTKDTDWPVWRRAGAPLGHQVSLFDSLYPAPPQTAFRKPLRVGDVKIWTNTRAGCHSGS